MAQLNCEEPIWCIYLGNYK